VTHTSGPWTVADIPGRDGGLRIFSLSDADIAPATVYGDTEEQRHSNAHLIAASPELLDACIMAVVRMEFSGDTDNPTYKRIAATIAKARRE
jgi:hypothetical protein